MATATVEPIGKKLPSLSDVINSRWEEVKSEDEKIAAFVNDEYRARVEAGLVDESKLKRYFEARRIVLDEVRRRPLTIPGASSPYAQQKQLLDRLLCSSLPMSTVSEVVESKVDTHELGECTTSDATLSSQKQIDFNLIAWNSGELPVVPRESVGHGILRFLIHGPNVHTSVATLTPYVVIKGFGATWGSYPFEPSSQSSVSVRVTTRLAQAPDPSYSYPLLSWITDISPGFDAIKYEYPANPINLYQSINFSDVVPQAASSAFVRPGCDLSLEVQIEAKAKSSGPYTGARLVVQVEVPWVTFEESLFDFQMLEGFTILSPASGFGTFEAHGKTHH